MKTVSAITIPLALDLSPIIHTTPVIHIIPILPGMARASQRAQKPLDGLLCAHGTAIWSNAEFLDLDMFETLGPAFFRKKKKPVAMTTAGT